MKQKLCDAGTAPPSDLGSHGTLHIGESPRIDDICTMSVEAMFGPE